MTPRNVEAFQQQFIKAAIYDQIEEITSLVLIFYVNSELFNNSIISSKFTVLSFRFPRAHFNMRDIHL